MAKILQQIKGKLIDQKVLLLYIKYLVYIYLFMKVSANLCYGTEARYQTIRDYCFYKAIAYFLVLLCIVVRVKLFNWPTLIFSLIYVSAGCFYLQKNQFEVELLNARLAIGVAFAIFGILVIDILMYKKILSFKKINMWFYLFTMATFLFALILAKGQVGTIVFICPFAILYLVSIEQEEWNKLLLTFSIGYYMSYIWIMAKSLIAVPYDGTRYWGTFLNLGTIGIFIGGAFVCTLYWLNLELRNGWKFNLKKIGIFLAMIASVLGMEMIGARSAELASIIVACVAFIMLPSKFSKKTIWKRVICIAIIGAVGIGLGFCLLKILHGIDEESLRASISSEIVCNKILYWQDRANTFFNTESKWGIIKEGTALNALDRFSSGRLTIAWSYIIDSTIWGRRTMVLINGVHHPIHPHNNYVSWIYYYGIICGSLILGWYAWLNVKVFRKVYNQKNLFTMLLLWVCFSAGAFLPETILWYYPTAFFILFLQYPILIDMTQDAVEVKG